MGLHNTVMNKTKARNNNRRKCVQEQSDENLVKKKEPYVLSVGSRIHICQCSTSNEIELIIFAIYFVHILLAYTYTDCS